MTAPLFYFTSAAAAAAARPCDSGLSLEPEPPGLGFIQGKQKVINMSGKVGHWSPSPRPPSPLTTTKPHSSIFPSFHDLFFLRSQSNVSEMQRPYWSIHHGVTGLILVGGGGWFRPVPAQTCWSPAVRHQMKSQEVLHSPVQSEQPALRLGDQPPCATAGSDIMCDEEAERPFT